MALNSTRVFGVIALVGVAVLGAATIQALLSPSDAALEREQRQEEQASREAAEQAARNAAEQARATATVACEDALRAEYGIAVDVSAWNSVQEETGAGLRIRGEDELDGGRLVRFECRIEEGRVSAELR